VVARPGLFARLGGPARVTAVTAPAGSGKTVLLRSWISDGDRSGCAAWVPVGRDGRDPQQFWLSVVAALRQTAACSGLVQPLTPAPDLDGWAITERLLAELAPLAGPLWLVVDDVHDLGPDVLRQLELLIMRAPPLLRFVLAARHDVRLGLHRLRLEGDLAEIRADDLRFSLPEADELFAAAGADVPAAAVSVLHGRTEGWVAGLRLAALSLTGHPDPARFAADFSGTDRTVAEYLLAEVLDRQPDQVRRLLLRTSILERVNGELADLLTGECGGERVLQDLEAANAFTMPLDGARTWFRYHQMFAGLLQLELRRSAPGEVAGLHVAAARWFAAHGYPVEAVRHAQAAGDFEMAARLLTDHWPGLHLDGQDTTVHELLAGFPAHARRADAELAVLAAADELASGSLETAEQYLEIADRASAPVLDSRRGQFQVLLAVARLLQARRRGNPQVVAEHARRLQAAAEAPGSAQRHLGDELRALALISLGTTEFWSGRSEEAHQHLEQGVGLARQVGRPFLEFRALAELATTEIAGPFAQSTEIGGPLTRQAECARQAIGLAERHGWTDEQAFGVACAALGFTLAWQVRLEEAESWIEHAERSVAAQAEPGAAVAVRYGRGTLELARGRDRNALAAFRSAELVAGGLDVPKPVVSRARALQVITLVRLGDSEHAEQALASLDERARERLDVRVATAALRLAQGDPRAATAALAPILHSSTAALPGMWLARALLLEAVAQDALRDQNAAASALERALDLTEPDGAVLPFLLYPAKGLLERHARRRTTHAALISEILGVLAGKTPAPPSAAGPALLIESLSESELRVLRYLPTHLTAPEIADQLYISVNTVKTHMRKVYGKLGSHGRAEAVARARDLGLLAPSARRAR